MAEGMKDNLNKTMDAQKGIAMKSRQSMLAAQHAGAKEMFRYQCCFFGLLYTILPIAALKNRNLKFLFPLVPISFVISF